MHNFEYNSYSELTFLHRINNTNATDTYRGVKHSHPQHEIFLLLSGGVKYTVNGQTFELHPFDLLILNAYEYHFVEPNLDEPYERMVLQISPSFIPVLNNVSPINGFIQTNSFLNIIPASFVKKTKLYDIMQQIEEICIKPNESYKDHLILAQAIALSIEINKAISMMRNDNTSIIRYSEYTYPQLNVCIQYINNHLHQPISLDDIVAQLHISKSHIQHLFKEVMGYSISDFILKQKMQLAIFMLNTGKSPTETAESLGYEYYSTFHTAFKKFYGYTPKDQVQNRKKQEKMR